VSSVCEECGSDHRQEDIRTFRRMLKSGLRDERVLWKMMFTQPSAVQEPIRAPEVGPGRKDDSGKDRWDLLPLKEIEQIVKVLTHGAGKYGANNWQGISSPIDRYYAAALRHLVAWVGGERLDKESGLPHLAHAACCLVFLMWFENSIQLERRGRV
jgi:hypothetical protein